MADFSKLFTAVQGVSDSIDKAVEVLKSDIADQEKVDQATGLLTGAQAKLDAAAVVPDVVPVP